MKFIVLSHGSFSKGIVDSVQMLVGKQDDLAAFELSPDEPTTALSARVEAEIKATKDEIICFTDLFHGSPFNVVVQLMRDYDIYHITGINIPLMVEAIMQRNAGQSAEDICKGIITLAPSTVVDVKAYLNQEV